MDPALQAILNSFLNSQPQAGFSNMFGPLINSRNQNLGNFAQGQYGRLYNQFLGQMPQNPTGTWMDFLGNQDIMSMFQNQTPRQRGENPSAFAPQVKWLPGWNG